MKIINAFLCIATLVAVSPTSIKTEYNNYEDISSAAEFDIHPFNTDAVLLSWKSTQENGILGFEVQRRNIEGVYRSVGFVPAFGVGAIHAYRFVDKPDRAGAIAYRIAEIGIDHHSKLTLDATFDFTPRVPFYGIDVNCGENSVLASFIAKGSLELHTNIFDSRGEKKYSSGPRVFDDGPHSFVWDRKDLSGHPVQPGVYVVEMRSGSYRTSTDIVLR